MMEVHVNETYEDGTVSGMTIPIGSVIQVEEENFFNYWGTWSNMMGTFKVCVPKKYCDEIIGQVNNSSDDKQEEFPSEIPPMIDLDLIQNSNKNLSISSRFVENQDRTCFSCIHSKVCFIKKNVTESTAHVRINIDSDELPGKWIDIFKTLANCCFEFKTK